MKNLRKLQLAIDVYRQGIVSLALTDNSVDDATMAKELLQPLKVKQEASMKMVRGARYKRQSIK